MSQEFDIKQEGIILEGESKFPVGEKKFNFELVGSGEARSNCGEKMVFVCKNIPAHNNTLVGNHTGKIPTNIKHRHCKRADCPVCMPSWAGEETDRAVHRYKQIAKIPEFMKKRLIHVILSPSQRALRECQNFPELRKEAQKTAKKSGLKGGSLVFHSRHKQCDLCGGEIDKRGRCIDCGAKQWSWNYYPHFHFLGYGWVDHEYKSKEESWLVVNLGVRKKNISGLIFYELSHAAFLGKKHIVSWFGCMSYNSLKCPKLEKKPNKCPLCGEKMKRLKSVGNFPDEEGLYYLTQREFEEFADPPDWITPPEETEEEEDLSDAIERFFSRNKVGY